MVSSGNWSTEANRGTPPTLSPPLPASEPVEWHPTAAPHLPPPQTQSLGLPYADHSQLLPLPSTFFVDPSATTHYFEQTYHHQSTPQSAVPPLSPHIQPPLPYEPPSSQCPPYIQSSLYSAPTAPPTYPTTTHPPFYPPTSSQPPFEIRSQAPSGWSSSSQPLYQPAHEPAPLQTYPAPHQALYDTSPPPWSPSSTATDAADRRRYIDRVTGPGQVDLGRTYSDKIETDLRKMKKRRERGKEEDDDEEEDDLEGGARKGRKSSKKRRKGEGKAKPRDKHYDDDKDHDGDGHGRGGHHGGRGGDNGNPASSVSHTSRRRR